MIRVSGIRHRGNETFPLPIWEASVNRALESLVVFELGYGGNVIAVSDNSVTVCTQILSCEDHVTFSGSIEEMQPLVDIASIYVIAVSDGQAMQTVADFLCQRLPEEFRGRALVICNLGPTLIGEMRVRLALLIYCDATFEPQERAITASWSLRDLLAVTQLVIEGECSFQEALALGQ